MITRHIDIYLKLEEYNKLREIKDKYGLTWAGMLKRGNMEEE